jgi:hypothetical protein
MTVAAVKVIDDVAQRSPKRRTGRLARREGREERASGGCVALPAPPRHQSMAVASSDDLRAVPVVDQIVGE